MGALSTVIVPDVLRSIEATTFTGNFLPIGTPLAYSMRIIKFQNFTNQTVFISWDGVNENDVLPPGAFTLLDISANKENAVYLEIEKGTQFYVQANAGTGFFYITCLYGK